jgi:RNA polymerase sigma factor (sigma-70 family)
MTNKTDMADKKLVARCLAGEDEFLELFVRTFSNLVYLTVQYTLKSKHAAYSQSDVEDLHNTVFVKLFEKKCRKLAQFKGKNGCSLRSWVRIIAARTVIDFLRNKDRDAISRQHEFVAIDELSDLAANVSDPFTVLAKIDQTRMLQDCMHKLKPRERLLLKLHVFRNLPIRQTAQLMGITENNAYTIKHRTIKRLRELMNMLKN